MAKPVPQAGYFFVADILLPVGEPMPCVPHTFTWAKLQIYIFIFLSTGRYERIVKLSDSGGSADTYQV